MLITEKDLIGKISGFPIPIVERMLQCQVEQGNNASVLIFQTKLDTSKKFGGFDWGLTVEGAKFWSSIFNYRNFVNFFSKYPQNDRPAVIETPTLFDTIEEIKQETVKEVKEVKEEETSESFILGETVICTNLNNLDVSLKEMIFVAKVEGVELPYLAMTKSSYTSLIQGGRGSISAFKNIKKVIKYVELTLQDISEGKGIGIDPNLIKIIS